MIKAGIVGCGHMGHVHARCIGQLRNVNLVGVADQNIESARRLASAADVNVAVASLEDLLAQARPDVIHLLTPVMSHPSLAREAMGAGCHVYVEKPMALTAAEAQTMVDAATAQQRLLTVGFNHLFEPHVHEAQRRLDSGRLGRLVGLDVFHNSLPNPAPWVKTLPSGEWMNDFDHLIYLSHHFHGMATAMQAVAVPDASGDRIGELHVGMQHGQGWSSLTYSTMTAPFQINLTLYGTRRVLSVDLLSGLIVERHALNVHRWVRKGLQAVQVMTQIGWQTACQTSRVLTGRVRGWGGLRGLLEAFYLAVETGGASPVPLDTALYVVAAKERLTAQAAAAATADD